MSANASKLPSEPRLLRRCTMYCSVEGADPQLFPREVKDASLTQTEIEIVAGRSESESGWSGTTTASFWRTKENAPGSSNESAGRLLHTGTGAPVTVPWLRNIEESATRVVVRSSSFQ